MAKAVSSWLELKPDSVSEATVTRILATSHPSVARLTIEKLHAHRQSKLALRGPVHRLVKFLFAEFKRSEPSKDATDSPSDLIANWLCEEVVRGYSSAEFGRAELLKWFGDELALEIVLRATAPRWGSPDPEHKPILDDFAAHIEEGLLEPGLAGLDPLPSLRLKIMLIVRAREAGVSNDLFENESATNVPGILDHKVDGSLAAFEAVAIGMVRIAHLRSGRTVRLQLEFERDLWEASVSEPIRRRMAEQWPADLGGTSVDRDDISEENQRLFARTRVRELVTPARV